MLIETAVGWRVHTNHRSPTRQNPVSRQLRRAPDSPQAWIPAPSKPDDWPIYSPASTESAQLAQHLTANQHSTCRKNLRRLPPPGRIC